MLASHDRPALSSPLSPSVVWRILRAGPFCPAEEGVGAGSERLLRSPLAGEKEEEEDDEEEKDAAAAAAADCVA